MHPLTHSIQLTTAIAIGLVIGLGAQFALAWTPAPASPPDAGSLKAPVTTYGRQVVDGGLILNSLGLSTLGLGIASGPVVVGPDLVTGNLEPSPDLFLDVNGKIGATEYCDENGTNCTSTVGGGATPPVPSCDLATERLIWRNDAWHCDYYWKFDIRGTTCSVAPQCDYHQNILQHTGNLSDVQMSIFVNANANVASPKSYEVYRTINFASLANGACDRPSSPSDALRDVVVTHNTGSQSVIFIRFCNDGGTLEVQKRSGAWNGTSRTSWYTDWQYFGNSLQL